MLSIGKLGQGQESYYLEAVAQGVEDYYTGVGEPPGRWVGSAAREVGMGGAEFINLTIEVFDGLQRAFHLRGQSFTEHDGRVDHGAVGSQGHTLLDSEQTLLQGVWAEGVMPAKEVEQGGTFDSLHR